MNARQMDETVSILLRHHFRHFNAAAVVDAADGYRAHIDGGGSMLVTLAGAMSTAELARSLAEMIRCDVVHTISCIGANLASPLGADAMPCSSTHCVIHGAGKI